MIIYYCHLFSLSVVADKPLPEVVIAQIERQTLHALDYLHEAAIIHRVWNEPLNQTRTCTHAYTHTGTLHL